MIDGMDGPVFPYGGLRARFGETVVLNTGNPEYYEPFGFRRIPEHRFRLRWNRGPRAVGTEPMRQLDYENPDDVALLRELLAERTPVSRRLGVVR